MHELEEREGDNAVRALAPSCSLPPLVMLTCAQC